MVRLIYFVIFNRTWLMAFLYVVSLVVVSDMRCETPTRYPNTNIILKPHDRLYFRHALCSIDCLSISVNLVGMRHPAEEEKLRTKARISILEFSFCAIFEGVPKRADCSSWPRICISRRGSWVRVHFFYHDRDVSAKPKIITQQQDCLRNLRGLELESLFFTTATVSIPRLNNNQLLLLDLSSRHRYGLDYVSALIDARASSSAQLSDYSSLSWCRTFKISVTTKSGL